MFPAIGDLILSWALLQPCGYVTNHCWWGMRTAVVFNRDGYGVKVSLWGSGETHIAFGRNGVIVGQFRIW